MLELLIVLAVLGLTVALALPRFDRGLQGVELKAAAREVARSLREARGLAIAGNREVAVVIDLDRRALSAPPVRAVSWDAEIGVSLFSAAEDLVDHRVGRIRFYPDGTSTGGRVRLFRQDRSYDVLVNWMTGNVSVQD